MNISNSHNRCIRLTTNYRHHQHDRCVDRRNHPTRMISTRLPGKVTLPVGNQTVLGQVIRRVVALISTDSVVVATPEIECDDIVALFSERYGASVYRRPHEDILTPLFGTADRHDADAIVQVSADSTLVIPRYIDHIVSKLRASRHD